jgi:hypothetical protein
MMTPDLDLLIRSLPENFSFYHLGEISLRNPNEIRQASLTLPIDDRRAALAYRLRGDLQAEVVLMLEPGLDLSMYSEAGNIIASRLATQLAEKHQIDVVISPPTRLEHEQLARLMSVTVEKIEKTYVHSYAGREILLEALILFHSSGSSS